MTRCFKKKPMSIRLSSRPHNYNIQEKLAESRLSVVYLAERSDPKFKLKHLVVLKVFKTKTLPALQMESFLRTRRCPRLAKVLAFERFQSHPALILEYIPGLNLKQLLLHTTLTSETINYICMEVLQGLKELQQNQLCHADLSPANILIDFKGRIYLTDYGLANYAGKEFYSTEPFSAPELKQNITPNFKSDLFSLGVLEKTLTNRLSENELTSMNNTYFICEGHPLLSQYPQKRTPKTFSYPPAAQNLLSAHMAQAVSKKPSTQKKQKLKTPFFLKPKFSVSYRAGASTFALAALLMALGLWGQGIRLKAELPGQNTSAILVRTSKWMYIQMAGVKGYTPITIPISKPGVYRMKWKTQTAQGHKQVVLTKGQTLLLTDQDFNSPVYSSFHP